MSESEADDRTPDEAVSASTTEAPEPTDGPATAARRQRQLMTSLGDGAIEEMRTDEGRAVLSYTAKEEFCHSGGVVQGGFITGWIDAAMAHAVIAQTAGRYWPATLELKVSFYRPVLPKTTVRAEGWIERRGSSIVFLAGRLSASDGEVLASATSTAKLLPTSLR